MKAVFYFEQLQCPEILAANWKRLPERAGYKILDLPQDLARDEWKIEADAEKRRITEGFYFKDIIVNDDLVNLIVKSQNAGFVYTEEAAFYVSAYPDYLQLHNTSCSWWFEINSMRSHDLQHTFPELKLNFDNNKQREILKTLLNSFRASGATETPECWRNGWIFKHCPPQSGKSPFRWLFPQFRRALFNFPTHLAFQWIRQEKNIFSPADLSKMISDFISLESRICFRKFFGNLLGNVEINLGPAFDTSTWKDSVFLSIKSKGLLPKNRIMNRLMKSASNEGAKLVGVW